MKDQYFGDVNDFRKYAILRSIASVNLRLGICWMLTAPDSRTDGRHLSYLTQPGKYRPSDPELFDWLTTVVHHEQDRRTARVEATKLLGNAIFHSETISDNGEDRRRWFANCQNNLGDCDLVFFDPDNGLERSIAYGRRNSCKFLYWNEVQAVFAAGASVLIYQHFPREPRNEFASRLAARLQVETGAGAVFLFRTPHVLFLLAARERHASSIRAVACTLNSSWHPAEIDVKEQLRAA